ncbi:MAG: PEGA domain-containing protein, partial [Spirochaetaceae bacterium]
RYSGSHEIGENLQFEVRAPGYVTGGTTIVVDAATPERHAIRLERERRTITVTAQPSDAAILLDGRRVAAGRHETSAPVDQTLTFRVERDGYAPADLTVDLARSTETSFTVVLEPRPIERRITASNAPLVRAVAVDGDGFLVADRNGAVTAVSSAGAVRWNTSTGNTPNENSPPVVAFGRVYLSGASEFVVMDLSTGSVVTRDALGADSAHIFGRRVVAAAGGLYYPTNRGIDVLDQSGARTESIPITGGSSMTPAISGNRIVIANQSGVVFVLDAASNAVVAEIPTDAAQPVALAPAVADGVAYIAGRRGNIAAINIGAGSVVWQTDLDPDRSMGSYVDPVVGSGSVFFFARDTIYALQQSNGVRKFAPIAGVSGPPLAADGSIVYGTTAGTLVVADAVTGRLKAEIELGARVTTRPALWNGRYVVGLENGELVIVNPVGVIR